VSIYKKQPCPSRVGASSDFFSKDALLKVQDGNPSRPRAHLLCAHILYTEATRDMPSSLDITELYELESLYTESRHLLDTSAVPAGSNDVCSMHKTVTSTSDADVQSLDDDEASPSSAQPGQLLKKTISLGLAIAIVVFAINLVVLIWAYARSRSFDGSCIFYTGSCATSRHISLVISVFINLLSTLLLAASNNAGQYISSPTRENIDKAHSSGRWLYIGSFSFRNLRYIGWRRTLLWLGFMCSSVPLHLL